jgi:hypothetical protein
MSDSANASTLTPSASELKLGATEQELISEEVRAFAGLQPPGPARERYAALAELVETGAVPADRLDQLGTILEIGLQSGRIRRVYGPDGEMAIGRIYQRTPRGTEATAGAATVTRALEAIKGQIVDEIRVTALGPGSYSILFDTTQCQITVRLDRGGVRIDSLSVGM